MEFRHFTFLYFGRPFKNATTVDDIIIIEPQVSISSENIHFQFSVII